MAYGPRATKDETIPTTIYTIHYPHSTPRWQRSWQAEGLWQQHGYVQVASIDPAINNCAMRIERWYADKRIVPIYYAYVSFIYTDGENISTLIRQITDYLDAYKSYFQQCHYIIMERQLPICYNALCISEMMLTYFNITLRDTGMLADIFEISGKLKGKPLGMPKGLDKPTRKKWSVAKARQQLSMRGDEWSLNVIDTAAKKDDLGDVITMIIGLFIKIGLVPAADFTRNPVSVHNGVIQDPL